MPTFTQHLIAEIAADGKWHRDTGGKNSVTGLMVYSGKRAKTYYVGTDCGAEVKFANAGKYTLKRTRIEAQRILGKATDGHDFKAERRRKRILKDEQLLTYLDGPFKTHAVANIASHKDMLR